MIVSFGISPVGRKRKFWVWNRLDALSGCFCWSLLNIFFTESLAECVFGASRWRASHEDDSLSARVCRKRVCRWHGPLGAFVKGLVFTLGGHLLHCQAHMPFNGMDKTKFRRLFVFFAALVCWDGSASRSWNWCHRSVSLPEPTQCLVSFRGCQLHVGGSESLRWWCHDVKGNHDAL